MDEDRNFRFMVAYFWREKSDPTRYCDFDEARFAKLEPAFYHAWRNYLAAEIVVNTIADTVAIKNDPDAEYAA